LRPKFDFHTELNALIPRWSRQATATQTVRTITSMIVGAHCLCIGFRVAATAGAKSLRIAGETV
jgi:hypothetical protein